MSQILIIEPDRLLAKTYQAALKVSGHKVRVANGSQDAIHMADKITPDVVILELQLVGHSGVEFLYEFRSYTDWQSIPVLIHSQVPYSELLDSWPILNQQLGVSDYSYKPSTSLESLISNVDKLTLSV